MNPLSNKKITSLIFILCMQLCVFAQQTSEPLPPVDMADKLYNSGRIYGVIGVLVAIFIGIIIYLIMLDKKISKLEKEINKN